MVEKEWSPNEDRLLKEAALEETRVGGGNAQELSFWIGLEKNQLLPRYRQPEECLKRYCTLSAKITEDPQKNSTEDLTPSNTDLPEPVDEILEEIKPVPTSTKNDKGRSNCKKRLEVIFDFSGDELDDSGQPSRLNCKRRHTDLFEDEESLESKAIRDAQRQKEIQFQAGVRSLLAVAKQPDICRVLGLETSEKIVSKWLEKYHGKESPMELRNHLRSRILCTEVRSMIKELRETALDEVCEVQLISILDKGIYSFKKGSDKRVSSMLFKAVMCMVKAAVRNGSDELNVLESIANKSKARFRTWEPFLDRQLFRSEMRSLKSFLLDKYKGVESVSHDVLDISELLETVEKNLESRERKVEQILEDKFGLGAKMEEDLGVEPFLKSNWNRKKGEEKLLELRFFSDDEAEDDCYQTRKAWSGKSCQEMEAHGARQSSKTKSAGIQNSRNVRIKTGAFSSDEDKLLNKGIVKYGFGNWMTILDLLFVPNGYLRHPTSLKDRARVLGHVSTEKKRKKKNRKSVPLLALDSSSS